MYDELAELLKATFRNLPLNMECDADAWDKMLVLAEEHNIETMLYPKVKELLSNRRELKEVLEKWRAHTYVTQLEMASTLSMVAPFLRLCNDEGLVIMGLKGIYLRTLYASPDFRTMGDVDFLIHEKDRMAACKHIISLGYEHAGKESGESVDVYDHKTGVRLEIHKHFTEMKSPCDSGKLENDLWQTAHEYVLPEGKIWLPSHPMHVVFLLLHMAKHFLEIGFGLRQLVDLVLIMEKNDLDAMEIHELARQYGLGQFFLCMVNLCNLMLGMKIPDELAFKTDEPRIMLAVLKQEVLKGGVFGDAEGKKIPRILAMILHDKDNISGAMNESGFSRMMRLLFPRSEQLSPRYAYATRSVFLLPFAWIHRWVTNIFTRHLKLSEKIGVLRISPEYEQRKSGLQGWMKIG